VVEHTFPDGSFAYSLYGHMEQTDSIFFPSVGACVERGQVVGAIGWPSMGRPHLHFEFRDFLPNDGGPGYVTGNPLTEGWYNPLDFTALWRARLTPAFVAYATFDLVPSVPPVRLDSGQYVIASSNLIEGILPPNQTLWTVEADGVVTGLAALPGNQIVAHTRNGQVLVLDNGRYVAIWTVNGPETPFLVLNQTLVFVTDGGGLAAYDMAGTALWTLPGAGSDRVVSLDTDGEQIAFGVRTDTAVVWRMVGLDGQVAVEQQFETFAANAALGSGSWLVLDGANLNQHTGAETRVLAEVTPLPGRAAALTTDALGNSYLYLGDADSTLLAYGPDGTLRWQVTYPTAPAYLPPLLAVGKGCWLYTLDVDGMFNVFSTADGTLVNQLQLYAGGTERTMPAARLLRVDSATEQIEVATGFLTTLLLDGNHFNRDGGGCLLG
jgi:hypothetical protein